MASINCSHEACNKVFEKPVVVTNFSFAPKKETYYACPYCLTRIDFAINDCELASVTAETPANIEGGNLNEVNITPYTVQEHYTNENSAEHSMGLDSVMPQRIALENIKNLEKEKADLLAELEELKKGAEDKISCLEKEVAALREEAELLKKLAEN